MNLIDRLPFPWISLAVIVGLALRIAFSTLYWVDKPLTNDEHEYLALAKSLAAGRGFTYEFSNSPGTGQQFGRAPGYSMFLALIGAGTGAHTTAPLRVKMAQAFLGAFTILLIGLITTYSMGERAGNIAATIAAVYPPLVWISSYVFSESLYAPIALLTAHTLQRAVASDAGHHRGKRTVMQVIGSGGLAGTAILVRPAMILFVLLAVVWLLASRRPTFAVALLIGSIVVVAPWTYRNARVHGRLILVASEGGVTFWTGNHPLAGGEGDLAANPQLKIADQEFRRAHHGLSPEELEPLYYRAALDWIVANPGQWLNLLVRKAFYTVVPIGPSYTLHSTRYWAASVISYGLVLPFALAGFSRLWRSPRRPTAILLLGLSAVLVGLVFFPQERFRIPVIDPVLIIAAAAALVTFTRRLDLHGAIA